MVYVAVLLVFATINTVFAYHFLNPVTHELYESSSRINVPRGYRLLQQTRNYRRRSRLSRDKRNLQCTDGGFSCDRPYDKSITSQFECTSDNQCPQHYKCCSQKCFLHKVCVKASASPTHNKQKNCTNDQRPGQCEKWPYNCQTPYDYSRTSLFKCDYDKQCPRNFKCCQQNCFSHNICSRIVKGIVPEYPIKQVSVSTYNRRQDENEITPETFAIEEVTEEEIKEEITTPTTTEATTTTEAVEEEPNNNEDYNDTEIKTEGTTTENLPTTERAEPYDDETGEAEEEQQTKNDEETTETQEETTEVEETEQVEKNTNKTEMKSTKPSVLVKDTPKRTTLDSNAIVPNYSEYYYDNNNSTNEEGDDYNDNDDDYAYDNNEEESF